METFPDTIPLPDQSLNSESTTPVTRTNMEGGQARQIIKFSTGARTYAAQWTFTGAEYELFKTFFYTTLNNGVDWFTMSLPIEGGGFETTTLRFVGGKISDSYVTFDTWRVVAALEAPITQLVEAPAQTLTPVWYQPERDIYINTTLGPEYANNLLVCHPSTGETITLTVPEIDTPSDELPFGIINKGPGNVLIKILEEAEPDPDPTLTWMDLAISMGAWGVYRMDDAFISIVEDDDDNQFVGGIIDLSPNFHTLTDPDPTNEDIPEANRLDKVATFGGGFIHASNSTNRCFRAPLDDTLTSFHVLAIQKVAVGGSDGDTLTLKKASNPVIDPITAMGSATSGGGQWSIHADTVNGNTTTTKNYPTSGTTPRLLEIVSYSDGNINFFVNSHCIFSGTGAGGLADALQLGGRNAKDGFTSSCSTGAVVIFDTTANWGTPEGREDIQKLREMMLADYT